MHFEEIILNMHLNFNLNENRVEIIRSKHDFTIFYKYSNGNNFNRLFVHIIIITRNYAEYF